MLLIFVVFWYIIVQGAQLVMYCDQGLSRVHSAKITSSLWHSASLLGVNLLLGCHFLHAQ